MTRAAQQAGQQAGQQAEQPVAQSALEVHTPEQMRELGRQLAALLRAGDLVVLTGDLGAGKTTLTQGIGAGLGVRGAVTSPTFVIARVHPAGSTGSGGSGPALVHVDAYRLGSLAEVDDLDLGTSLAESITVVEWGHGLVEDLADARLDVRLRRPRGDELAPQDAGEPTSDDDEPRRVELAGYGDRWRGVALPVALNVEG